LTFSGVPVTVRVDKTKSIFYPFCGKRNKHGYPLKRIMIFGKDGKNIITQWKKKWLNHG